MGVIINDLLRIAEGLSQELLTLSEGIEKLDSVDKMVQVSKELTALCERARTENISLLEAHGKSIKPGKGGRLRNLTEIFKERLDVINQRVEKARTLRESSLSDEHILSDSDVLKGIGR